MALAIVLIKANRNLHALLILVPLLTLNLLWLGFRKAMGFRSVDAEMFTMLFLSFVIGISIVWLLGHKIGNRNRLVTFLLALVIIAVIGLVGVVSYGAADMSEETTLAITLVVLALAVLVSLALAGWCCRKRFGGPRFLLWLGLWTIAVSVLSVVLMLVVVFFIQGMPTFSIATLLLQIMLAGLILGVFVYVAALPFLILALCSPFFWERLRACLQLNSMAPAAATAAQPISPPDRPENGDSA